MSEPTMQLPASWPPDVAKGIVAAQAAVASVPNDAKNEHHRYRYTSAEAVIQAAKKAMEAGRVALVLVHWHLVDERGEGWTMPDRGSAEIGQVAARWMLVGEAGGAVEVAASMPALADRGRPVDKAVATALTYLQAYVLRGVLSMARTEEHADVDQRDDRDHVPQQRQRHARAQQAARSPGEVEYQLLRKRLATELEGAGHPKDTWVAVLTDLVGYPWPTNTPSIEQLRQAVHSVAVSRREPGEDDGE